MPDPVRLAEALGALASPAMRQALAAERLRRQEAADRVRDEAEEAHRCDWRARGRPEQMIPGPMADGADWAYWLILAGRGWGKTRVGAETVRQWIKDGFNYVNLIGATADDARDIMIDGESGILAKCPRDERPEYKPSKRALFWPNGARSLIFTADKPERLRGKQHQKLWADELAAWRYPEAWDQAQFGLRIGRKPQAIITTTPKPIKIVREIAADIATVITRGSTHDNRANLAPKFFERIIKKYEGTRLGRQELNAEILDDNPNALWQRPVIEALRVKVAPPMRRIVVGVDPAVTANEDSDLTGIVAAGLGIDDQFYVLDDDSLIESPLGWARKAVILYWNRMADRLVAEVNNGGDLVETVIRQVDPNVAYTAVRASRGKIIRAEPIAALYEQGRVHHVGTFGHLEDEMCDFDPLTAEKSPDRMDAMVWALTELVTPVEQAGLLSWMRSQAAANGPGEITLAMLELLAWVAAGPEPTRGAWLAEHPAAAHVLSSAVARELVVIGEGGRLEVTAAGAAALAQSEQKAA